ncbi:VanZ family protein [Robiginitalea sp. SC105]|nr:VanZ family protein [Robiginitalea sp. SC105]MBC2838783.1 VanZ family protein [Robiginitalea sp. SC105]
MAAVTYACLTSFEDLGDPGFDLPYSDKIAHFVFYLGAGILGVFALRERFGRRIGMNRALVLLVIGLSLYGGLIEGLQAILPTGRSAEWADFLANSCGLLLAVASVKGVFHEVKSLNWPD